MRDINRIRFIIRELELVWSSQPDLRICQLFMGITRAEVSDAKLFYMEDEAFLIKLEEFKNTILHTNENKCRNK